MRRSSGLMRVNTIGRYVRKSIELKLHVSKENAKLPEIFSLRKSIGPKHQQIVRNGRKLLCHTQRSYLVKPQFKLNINSSNNEAISGSREGHPYSGIIEKIPRSQQSKCNISTPHLLVDLFSKDRENLKKALIIQNKFTSKKANIKSYRNIAKSTKTRDVSQSTNSLYNKNKSFNLVTKSLNCQNALVNKLRHKMHKQPPLQVLQKYRRVPLLLSKVPNNKSVILSQPANKEKIAEENSFPWCFVFDSSDSDA